MALVGVTSVIIVAMDQSHSRNFCSIANPLKQRQILLGHGFDASGEVTHG
jgi:hypothetical protein